MPLGSLTAGREFTSPIIEDLPIRIAGDEALSEQNAQMTLAIADRAYVIETGSIVLHGRGRELLGRPEIAERYLGVGGDSAASRQDPEGRYARLVRGLADIFND